MARRRVLKHMPDGWSDDMGALQRYTAARSSLRVLAKRMTSEVGVYAPYAAEARMIVAEFDRLDFGELARCAAASTVELERYPRSRGVA